MGKIEEKNGGAGLQSAEEARDREFEQWVQQQFLKEAAAIEKEIDEIPDSENWKPTEESFQKLLQKAKEQGSVQSAPDSVQTTVSEDKFKDKENKDTKEEIVSEKLNKEKLNSETKKILNKDTGRHKFADIREKVIKWAAVAAVTVFGIFGVSMSSEANRAYIMERVDSMMGNDVGTTMDNEETLQGEVTEEEAKAEIEEVLAAELPDFFYFPKNLLFSTYEVDSEAKIGYLQYISDENLVVLTAFINDKNASAFALSDSGEMLGNITSQIFSPVQSTLWKVENEDDERPTYILQWDYKNIYYELTGKIEEEEMRSIAENIMY
ncbi:DUF4367 domain-containing protein [Blautia sp. An81]|uniref:DUF4367 domain-containing protein n=1 Tax=Blautia sp. An81 TaxID=1965659 RepID=UPI000B3900FA|nr:DUF4367 domain-containing protein [Blautia sp. An81]OUN28178.1 hypothetical protein B5G33_12430 [Blautia sp. An81]